MKQNTIKTATKIDAGKFVTMNSSGETEESIKSPMTPFKYQITEMIKHHNFPKEMQERAICTKYGNIYFALTKWARKCKQKGFDSYEGCLDHYPVSLLPVTGELVCVGDFPESEEFVIYKITQVEPAYCGIGYSILHGVEFNE